MKKGILIFALIFIISVVAFADHPDGWGVGIMGRGGYGYGHGGLGGFAVSLKAPMLPIYWGINLDFYRNYFGIGIAGDYYLIDNNITEFGSSTLGWYFGVGGFLGYGSYSPSGASWTSLAIGARAPVGLSFQLPLDSLTLEVFGALVPNLGLGFWFWSSKHDDYWKDEDRGRVGLVGGVGGELGVRLWF